MATIILAGGMSRRMGSDKASLEIEGSTLIELLVSGFGRELGPILVVTRPGCNLRVEHSVNVHDVYQGMGPLGGLHAGLAASPDDANLLLACDMPFADPELGRYLLSLLNDHDAVVPVLEKGPEPLFAAYRKTCLAQVETNLRSGVLKMQTLLDGIRTRYVAESDLRRYDPELRSFLNVNTPEDYARALSLLRAAARD